MVTYSIELYPTFIKNFINFSIKHTTKDCILLRIPRLTLAFRSLFFFAFLKYLRYTYFRLWLCDLKTNIRVELWSL